MDKKQLQPKVTSHDDYEFTSMGEGIMICGCMLLAFFIAVGVVIGLVWVLTHINWQYVHDALLPYTAWVVLGIFYTWYIFSKIKQYKNQKK